MIPSVSVQKVNGQTGVVRPGEDGLLGIISTMSTGTNNQPATFTSPDDIVASGGNGRLPSMAAYVLGETQNPVVAVLAAASTAATYGAIAHTGTGASVASGDVTSLPLDVWNPYIVIVAAGTVGTPGITYQYSLDGGQTLSSVQALGSATFISIPGTGIKLNFTVASMFAGDTYSCTTTPPYPTSADLTAALESLRVTSQPWDAVLVDTIGTSAIISQLDTWLIALEGQGIFRSALVNLRMKNAGESETAYAAYVAGVMANVATDRVVVAADGGDSVEFYQGVNVPRPASLFVAARGEANDIAVDVAEVDLGAITNCSITDVRNNPKYHDENQYQTLDSQRVATLRRFSGKQGVYITNPNIASGNGSDIVYWQQLRVLNKGCEISYQLLLNMLSKGVTKNPKKGPAGQVYISEQSAKKIEDYINAGLSQPMKNRCSGYLFSLSRTDDIGSNSGADINSEFQLEGLAYIKKFTVKAGFVRTIG